MLMISTIDSIRLRGSAGGSDTMPNPAAGPGGAIASEQDQACRRPARPTSARWLLAFQSAMQLGRADGSAPPAERKPAPPWRPGSVVLLARVHRVSSFRAAP